MFLALKTRLFQQNHKKSPKCSQGGGGELLLKFHKFPYPSLMTLCEDDMIHIDIGFMIVKVKEKLVQKEGEASMLASVNKQVLLRDSLSDHSYLPFNKTTRSSILYQTVLFPSKQVDRYFSDHSYQ